jgi:hypothetical protein
MFSALRIPSAIDPLWLISPKLALIRSLPDPPPDPVYVPAVNQVVLG